MREQKRKVQSNTSQSSTSDDAFSLLENSLEASLNDSSESEESESSDSDESEESNYSGLSDEADTSDDDSKESEDDANDDNRDVKTTEVKKEKGKKLPLKGKAAREKKVSEKKSENKIGVGVKNEAVDEDRKVEDEYLADSSDEEDIRNTIGNVPIEWYDEFSHVGYDLEGKKIAKPTSAGSADKMDEHIERMENADYWHTVIDRSTGRKVTLSDDDAEFIGRLRKGRFVDPSYDPYKPWVDFFTHDVMKHPVTNRPEHKRSFIPSLLDRQKVGKMVHSIKMGWMKPVGTRTTAEDKGPVFYDLWASSDQTEMNKRHQHYIPAPHRALPGHEESYNPPPEYLFTKEEEEKWNETEPEKRRVKVVPRRYPSLRQTPAYNRFINEQFQRLLDLYLCPRKRVMRMNVNPEDLLPKLPKPRDLQPFPTTKAFVFSGHMALVRCINVDSSGQWLVSGADDQSVKFWEVSTGRCMKTLVVGGAVQDVSWNPNPALCLVTVAVGNDILVVNPSIGDKLVIANTDNVLRSNADGNSSAGMNAKKIDVQWSVCDGSDRERGLRIRITHPKPLSQVSWHSHGDYFVIVMPDGHSTSVVIHQLSKLKSQIPFQKSKGLVQSVLFHPTRPFLFVATQRFIRVYNLVKQELSKKLTTNVKWISSMAIHPGGDNLIIGSYDCRLAWFDLDLSTKPYQTIRHHKKAIRQVCYHKRYPLFASASDDGTVIVCHGRVFSDLMQNALIVPVKVLRDHQPAKDLCVLDCEFHPTQPWLFASGSDSNIVLYS